MGALDELERAHEAAAEDVDIGVYLDRVHKLRDTVPVALAEARAQAARLRALEEKHEATLAELETATIRGRELVEEAELDAMAAEKRAEVAELWLREIERERVARNDVALSAERHLLEAGSELAAALERAEAAEANAAAWERAQAGACVLRPTPEQCLSIRDSVYSDDDDFDAQLDSTDFVAAGYVAGSRETAARIVARLEGVPVENLIDAFAWDPSYATLRKGLEAVRRRLLASLTESGAAPDVALAAPASERPIKPDADHGAIIKACAALLHASCDCTTSEEADARAEIAHAAKCAADRLRRRATENGPGAI